MSSQPKKISLPIGNKKVEDLLLWRDVKLSGAVVLGVTVVYFGLIWLKYSLVTLIANVLLLAVAIFFGWNNVAVSVAKRSPLPVPKILVDGITEGEVKSFAEKHTVTINKAIAFLNRLVTGKDLLLSVQVGVTLYLVGKLGSLFSLLGLVYTVLIAAFTLPKLYEWKKEEIDFYFEKAVKQTKQAYNTHLAPIVNKIPRASTTTSDSNGKKVQ